MFCKGKGVGCLADEQPLADRGVNPAATMLAEEVREMAGNTGFTAFKFFARVFRWFSRHGVLEATA